MGKRNLYLSNTPVEEALDQYLAALGERPVAFERLPVTDCLDRVTSEAIFARFNSPLYDSAAMDGIAVVSTHTEGARETLPVTLLPDRDFVVVDTGDPVRLPYDAVMMAEDLDPQENGTVVIRAGAAPWQHVRPVGEDIVKGEMLLPGLHTIRPIDIGVLLSGGITSLAVLSRPRVAVIPTGTELIEPDAQPREGDIIESNSRMFEALIRQEGGTPVRFSSVDDEYETIKQVIGSAAEKNDMVLVIAGSSAGTEDYTVHVLRELGDVLIHGVAMKPGKPVILAIVSGKPVIGLPGYPVSAYLAYQTFAAPVLSHMTRKPPVTVETVEAVLTRRLVSSLKHREYVRVKLGEVGSRLVASPLARGAGAAMSLVRSDGFCVIDQNSEGLEAGETAQIQLTRHRSEYAKTLVSIGSHDLALDVIADLLPELCPGYHLSSTHVGSMGGLMALTRGETHIAPIHLLDEGSGAYNIPVLKALFPGQEMALIKGVGRTQGMMVQKGNPLDIHGVGDLRRLRFVNRQRGAGTRVLLDYLLKCEGIDPSELTGYGREAATHMAVAAAVDSGSADAGMGVLSAARAMGLDFIPIGQEEYDFALPAANLELDVVNAFIRALNSKKLHRKLEELGGYTDDRTGEIILIYE